MVWWWPSSSSGSSSGSSSTGVSSNNASADACPVDHQTRSQWIDAANPTGAQASSSSSSAFSSSPDSNNACPVDHTTRTAWANAAASGSSSHPHSPHTPKPLSTERETSSIPRTESANWVYPSPKQFFDALVRKGYIQGSDTSSGSGGGSAASLARSHGSGSDSATMEGSSGTAPPLQVSPSASTSPGGQGHILRATRTRPREEDMDVIVPIHNAVNERAWAEVMRWERERVEVERRQARASADGDAGEDTVCRCEDVKLVSFKGRPGDLSPKARFKSLIGYQKPFDRHDWLVDRCGTQVRYVLDFYTGRPLPGAPTNLAFYLDVRPALDSWDAVKMRMRRFCGQWCE